MNNLETILSQLYGVGPVAAPKEAVLWAADRIEDANIARKEIKRINRIRSKFGKPVVYVPFGHKAF